eukprot:SAG11_NODE_1615_length_4578_cov_6.001786_4_plen_144_part_00
MLPSQALVSLNLGSAFLVFLTKFDILFDAKYSARRATGFRLYLALFGMVLSLLAMALSTTRFAVLGSVGFLGVAAAMINAVGSNLFGAARTRSLISLWIATGLGGLVCLLLCALSGFHSPGTLASYRECREECRGTHVSKRWP